MKGQILLQHENELSIIDIAFEETNFYKILRRLNAKQISYWKKLLNSGYIVFLDFQINNINIQYRAIKIVKNNKEFSREQLTITVLNPDGTNKTINFNHRLITAFDENNHKKSYLLDGHDRIINALEFNNNPILDAILNVTSEEMYNTSYEYDTQDNLVKITDALGNKFTFSYDSLGRRISLSDPDLGNWTYEYDLAGNLITQKQNGGGNLVSGDGYYREYDGLNQLIRIRNSTSTSPVVEEYSYDPFGQRIKIARNDTANTTIYTPFKELMRIRNTTGVYDFTYVYQRGFYEN